MNKKRYRIVRDGFAGYEVQFKRFFMWVQAGKHGGMGTNTHASIEDAEAFIVKHSEIGEVVQDETTS
jgi:hypothetical protein